MKWRVQTEVEANNSEAAFEAGYWKIRQEYVRPGSEEVLVIPLDEEEEND